MAEPTFSELADVKVDSERGTGTPAVVYNNLPLLQILNQQAEFQAKNQLARYQQFQSNLEGVYKELRDTAKMETMPQDRDVLQERMANVFKQIDENPHSLLGGPGYEKINEELVKLDQDSAESAKNYLYDSAHRQLLSKEPGFGTPENKKTIDDYANGKLGTRKAYSLAMPGLFDPLTLSSAINEAVKTPFSETKLSDDGKFIDTYTGTRYPMDKYQHAASVMYDLPDKQNVPLKNTIQQRFAALPKETQDHYTQKSPEDPAKAYYMDIMTGYHKDDATTKSGSKDNPYELLGARQKGALVLESVKQGNRKDLAMLKHNLAGEPTTKQTEVLLDLVGDVMGNTTGKTLSVEGSDKKYSTEPILDVSTPIKIALSEKGREAIRQGSNLDEIGETITTTDMPDVVTRTKDGGLRTVYYKKYTRDDIYDAKGNPKKGLPANAKVGEVVRDSSGNAVHRSQQIIPQTETISILGKDLFDKKQLAAGVGNVVNYLKQNHKGNILDYIKSNKEAKKKYKTGGKSYSQKDLKGLGYTDEQINAAIQAGTLEDDDEEENK